MKICGKYICSSLSVTLFILLITGIFIGCSNEITKYNSSNSIDYEQTSYDEQNMVDELWVIGHHQSTKSDLTIEEIQRLIEENDSLYTKDGLLDVDLLRLFILENFKSVEIITDSDDIAEILRGIKVCCKYNPETNKYTIYITKK